MSDMDKEGMSVETPFITLPFETDDRTPEGYRYVVAYAKGYDVVLPINTAKLANEADHNCDAEGCGTMDHVVRFSITPADKEK